ncbi:ABC transporter permease [Dactylosporangium sp. CA-139066]|uniref:ABC transporter permease n=1 Tax=Dactylosporangium sp. CA-139066 TaxID=3239930 RepID=UPI003D8E6E7A
MSAFAAEWIKLRTLRATRWPLALTALAAAAMAYLVGLSFAHADPATMRFDATFANYYSLSFAQLALVVFAVTAVAGEYGSGTIRASLAAVPRRSTFYLAKLAALTLCAATVALLSVAASFTAAQAGLAPRLRTPLALETAAGAWLYLVLIALFAAGVAQALRSTALSLGILLPLFFLGSQGLGNIPGVWHATQFLPDQAGVTILHFFGDPASPDYNRAFGPRGGLAILAAWSAAALVTGWLTLRHRDA